MAQLKDTLIQGSARVTDTLYSNTVYAPHLTTQIISTDDEYSQIILQAKSVRSARPNGSLDGQTMTFGLPGIYFASNTQGSNRYIQAKYNNMGSTILSINTDNKISGLQEIVASPVISGTLKLTKTTDASGTENNLPALIVGGTQTAAHLEFDANEVMAKASGTTVASLYLNNEGGAVYINNGYGTISVSTAVDDSGLRVYARRAANKSVIDAYSGFAAANGTYSWGLNHLAPNIVAGANTCLITGVANSTNNQGVLEFHYAGSNNEGNYVGLGLYGNNGLLKIFKDKHVEIDTLKIMNTNAVAHIAFTRTSNPSYISIPDNEILVINNGTTFGTAYASLGITKTYVYNAYGGHLGTSSYYWGNIYAKGYIYMKGTNQYPLDFFIYNKHGNQVAEMWYDCGATETVTGGAWRFRQFSPAATPAATTSGFKETYRLPTVANGLTADKNYDILTTRNTITAAQGGTGVTSHTANRLVWSTSATAIQAGYHYASTTKVAINYTSEPTTNFYVGGNAMVNGATAATTTTQSGQFIVKSGTGSNAVGIELYRNSNVSWQIFNTSGNLQINNNFSGSDTTAQTTYKYKVLEFNYQTLLATFGGSIYLNGTVASNSTGSTAAYDETCTGPKIIFNDSGQRAYLIGDRYDASSDGQFGFTLGLVSIENNGGAFRANGIKATSKMVVNSTFDSTYTFKVGGTSLFTDKVTINHTTPTYAFSVSNSEKASIEYNSTNHVMNFIVT